ncbi:MAG: UDP-glucose 4-epimerase GalE [Ilumatobacteraceae bacterium]|jgi:UDP-glucose-4-epimerase GalE|nr:UDP-glucose 4-epimerase GalE [Ilumatobacteraceae bacterium]
MTVLITGGAGYIGSITTRLIRASGRGVVVLDTLENGHRKAVGDAPFVQGDIADSDLIARVVAEHQVDEVVHFAAYKAVGESMSNPGKYFSNNVTGSQKLFESLHKAGVTRVVFSSTAAVYGTPQSVPVRESDVLSCESVYAETKLMIEKTLGWYSHTTPMRNVCLRYFNAAGASEDATLGEDWRFSQNLIPHVMKAVLGFAPALTVFGNDFPTPDGTGVRDYIHVEDLAHAHVAALDYLAKGNDSITCNVGTGYGTSVMDIIATTERVTGKKVPYEIIGRRAGDPSECYADPRRINEAFGWAPTHSLDDIISSAYAWHTLHPQGHDS